MSTCLHSGTDKIQIVLQIHLIKILHTDDKHKRYTTRSGKINTQLYNLY